MVSRNYMNVVELRKLLLGMEKDLGLGHLSQNEKDVFYAVMSVISDRNGVAKSDEIKNHDLVADMTQPTFHRCLKNLVKMKLLDHAPNTKAGSYVASDNGSQGEEQRVSA